MSYLGSKALNTPGGLYILIMMWSVTHEGNPGTFLWANFETLPGDTNCIYLNLKLRQSYL